MDSRNYLDDLFCWLHHQIRSLIDVIRFLSKSMILLTIMSAFVPAISAQSGTNPWSKSVEISAAPGFASAPQLLADRYGRLHAFWVASTSPERNPEEDEAILYTLYDGEQWATANDVIARSGLILDLAVVLDETDRFHMLLIDQNSGALLYSTAEMWDASHPLSWSVPQLVVGGQVYNAAMTINAGRLFVAYTLFEDPFEVYLTHSSVVDVSWSNPTQVSNVLKHGDEVALSPSLTHTRNGSLYLVWAQHALPEGYPPRRIMFSSSQDGGMTWSEPTQLSEGRYGLPSILVASDELLYVTYNGAVGTSGRYLLYSTDAGAHWSERIVIDPGVGGLTGGTMALDCAGTLHYASAGDADAGNHAGINGVAYSQWADRRWEPMRNIAGMAPGTDNKMRQGYEPAMAIAQCNQIHVIYLGADHASVHHTATQSNAVSVTPVPLASLMPSPTATPVATTITPGILTPVPSLEIECEALETTSATYLHPVIVGALTAFIFAVIALFVRFRGLRSSVL